MEWRHKQSTAQCSQLCLFGLQDEIDSYGFLLQAASPTRSHGLGWNAKTGRSWHSIFSDESVRLYKRRQTSRSIETIIEECPCHRYLEGQRLLRRYAITKNN